MAPTLKTAEEIEKMRVAGAISANVLDQVADMVRVGAAPPSSTAPATRRFSPPAGSRRR